MNNEFEITSGVASPTCITMVIAFMLLIFTPCNAMAQTAIEDPYEGGDKYGEVRPYKMTKVKAVQIKENGAWSKGLSSGDETPEVCSSFKLKKRDVCEYFRRSRRVSYRTYMGVLTTSRCYATGDVVFENGDYGTWMIDLQRRGILTLSDGRNLYFYCTKCTAKVYD